jgi:hypothetical protein
MFLVGSKTSASLPVTSTSPLGNSVEVWPDWAEIMGAAGPQVPKPDGATRGSSSSTSGRKRDSRRGGLPFLGNRRIKVWRVMNFPTYQKDERRA